MITPGDAQRRWRGVVVPLPTIFGEDGSLDLETTADHVRWILECGAHAGNTLFLAGGSGGDFPMLNLDERKQVIRKIAEVTAGEVPILIGVQSTDIRDTIELCQLGEDLGVDAAQISGPYYYDGRWDDVVAWFQEVARHTQVGFAVYNNWYTGYNMPLELIERLLEIPNSVAVKWGSPDIFTFYAGIRRFSPRVAVVDNSLWPVMPHMLGCRAFVSHVPNFYPEHAWRVWDLMERGLYLEAQQAHDALMVPYLELVGRIQNVTAGEAVFVRAAMMAAGRPAGRSRLPSRDDAVTPEIRDGFRALLAEVAAMEFSPAVGVRQS